MFGYIKTDTPDLKVRDYEIYKGVYCSLCKTLGKRYGLISRMFLSYDSTFLALLLLSQEKSCPCFTDMRCTFNPLKKCKKCRNGDAALNFAADVSVLLTYYKLKDNIEDCSFLKGLVFRFLKLTVTPHFKKAKTYNSKAEKIVNDYIKKQALTEKENCKSIDSACEPTAKMLSTLLQFALKDSEFINEFSSLGYLLGRWIYLIDAFDDIEKDKKNDNYNVFIKSGNCNKEKIKCDLLMTLGEAYKISKEITYIHFSPIIDNILRDGLYKQTLAVYNGGKKNEQSL